MASVARSAASKPLNRLPRRLLTTSATRRHEPSKRKPPLGSDAYAMGAEGAEAGPSSGAGGPTTHFGYKDVPESLKESLGEPASLHSSLSVTLTLWRTVGRVFTSVASSYDLMNDAMSLGIHRLWKDHFVRSLDPHGGLRCLDVAGGTGDISFRILDHARTSHADRETSVHVVDINPDMLEEGKKRAKKSMYYGTPQISFGLGNAEDLAEIEDGSVDMYTVAFGIRNCTHIDKVLKEAHRVLKPGGRFSCLEFSKVVNPVLAKCVLPSALSPAAVDRPARAYEAYSFNVIPNLGAILAADRDSYQCPCPRLPLRLRVADQTLQTWSSRSSASPRSPSSPR